MYRIINNITVQSYQTLGPKYRLNIILSPKVGPTAVADSKIGINISSKKGPRSNLPVLLVLSSDYSGL